MRSQYEVERMKYSDLVASVVLPSYQRKLVWSEKQKREFIENISQGFPFGSILLYRYEGEKKLSLIDGLQRFSTLRSYSSNPAIYFNRYDPFVEDVLRSIESFDGITLSEDQRDDLVPQIEDVFRRCLEQSDYDTLFVRNEIKSRISIFPTVFEALDSLVYVQQDLKKAADDYLDLDELVIPCVVFTGDESQLPEVFANLNQGGTKLSKYQVLAAHWTNYEFKLPYTDRADAILEKVVDRYLYLEEKRELHIIDFDREEMEQTRTINLAEFCFAFGELIAEKTPVFWGDAVKAENDKKEDVFNLLGYLTTAIALGVDVRSINKLPNKIHLFESGDFIDALLGKVFGEYAILQSEFARWLTIPGSGKPCYESGPITDLQALSFFAALWHKRYVVDEDERQIKTIERYREKGYEETRKNLIAYCVSDVVGHTWRGSGDSRLANFYVKGDETLSNYYLRVSREFLDARLIGWYEEASRGGSINVEKISKFLLCIHAAPNRLNYKADEYDIEHVIAKKILKKDSLYSNQGIPGGVLGNLMYLKPKTNRGKGELDLYTLLDHEGVSLEDGYLARICYPTEAQIRGAVESLNAGNGEKAKSLIRERGKEIIDEILKTLPLS